MSDIDNDTLKVLAIFLMLGFLVFVVLFAFTMSAGCITKSKELAKKAMEGTPTPTEPVVIATETPFPTNTNTPIPTPTFDKEKWMIENGGYHLNSWHQWYRENVAGQQDMIIRATVYNYKLIPSYHWRDFSWGSRATRKETAYPGYKFLFLFVRMESIGTSDTTYGFGPDHWYIQINNTIMVPDDEENPEWKIVELENDWTRDHVETPPPYGYKQVQEAGTGIISAERLEWLKNGEPWDGYLIFQVPADSKIEDFRVIGRFDNVGGDAWWYLN